MMRVAFFCMILLLTVSFPSGLQAQQPAGSSSATTVERGFSAESTPAPEENSSIPGYVIGFLGSALVLVVVCMPSRKG
jgi:hypothetical protein